MEYLPTINGKVIYPKGKPFHKKTIFNFKVRAYEEKLLFKLPNEFKHCLKNYNPYNLYEQDTRFDRFLDDHNNYSYF